MRRIQRRVHALGLALIVLATIDLVSLAILAGDVEPDHPREAAARTDATSRAVVTTIPVVRTSPSAHRPAWSSSLHGEPAASLREANEAGCSAGVGIIPSENGVYIVDLVDEIPHDRTSEAVDQLSESYSFEVIHIYDHVLGGFAALMDASEACRLAADERVKLLQADGGASGDV